DDSDLTFNGSILTATFASTTALTVSGTASTTNQVISSLISGRIPYASTAGLLIDNSALTFDGTRLTATFASTTAISGTNIDFGTLTLTTALGISSGGTNASSFTTSGNAVYYDGTSLLTAPLTSAITIPYASTTALTISGTASTTNLIASALTSGRVPYITTAGAFTDDSDLTFNGSILTATFASSTALTVSGTASTTNFIVSGTASSTFSGPLTSHSGDFIIGSSGTSNDILLNPYGGNVGIRTTSPSNSLSIGDGSSEETLVLAGPGSRNITINTSGTSINSTSNALVLNSDAQNVVKLAMDTAGDTVIGVCKVEADGSSGKQTIEFKDCSSTPGDLAEWYEAEIGVETADIVALTDKTI
ncbi:MAG: hypothetical protein AAB834_06510, partial [Patescibacteria group bacterium]